MNKEIYDKIIRAPKYVEMILSPGQYISYYNRNNEIAYYTPKEKISVVARIGNGRVLEYLCEDSDFPIAGMTKEAHKFLLDYFNFRVRRRMLQGLNTDVIIGVSFLDGNYLVGYYKDYSYNLNFDGGFTVFINKANLGDRWIRWYEDKQPGILFLMKENKNNEVESMKFRIDMDNLRNY